MLLRLLSRSPFLGLAVGIFISSALAAPEAVNRIEVLRNVKEHLLLHRESHDELKKTLLKSFKRQIVAWKEDLRRLGPKEKDGCHEMLHELAEAFKIPEASDETLDAQVREILGKKTAKDVVSEFQGRFQAALKNENPIPGRGGSTLGESILGCFEELKGLPVDNDAKDGFCKALSEWVRGWAREPDVIREDLKVLDTMLTEPADKLQFADDGLTGAVRSSATEAVRSFAQKLGESCLDERLPLKDRALQLKALNPIIDEIRRSKLNSMGVEVDSAMRERFSYTARSLGRGDLKMELVMFPAVPDGTQEAAGAELQEVYYLLRGADAAVLGPIPAAAASDARDFYLIPGTPLRLTYQLQVKGLQAGEDKVTVIHRKLNGPRAGTRIEPKLPKRRIPGRTYVFDDEFDERGFWVDAAPWSTRTLLDRLVSFWSSEFDKPNFDERAVAELLKLLAASNLPKDGALKELLKPGVDPKKEEILPALRALKKDCDAQPENVFYLQLSAKNTNSDDLSAYSYFLGSDEDRLLRTKKGETLPLKGLPALFTGPKNLFGFSKPLADANPPRLLWEDFGVADLLRLAQATGDDLIAFDVCTVVPLQVERAKP